MYKLLLVDDEEDIRRGMALSIPWEEWGFEISGEAENGQKAVDIIKENQPDIILSDIRMPKMDGVELMKHVNENYPNIKIIILSGYNDVEYLNASIKSGVSEYLLKPTDIEEFEQLFRKMKNKLDEEKQKKEEFENLKQEVKEQKEYKHNKILNRLLKGYYPKSEKEIEQMELDFSKCIVSILDVQADEYKDNREAKTQFYELKSSIAEFCNQREEKYKVKFFLSDADELVGIIEIPELQILNWQTFIREYMKQIQIEISDIYALELAIGISDLCNETIETAAAYDQAKTGIKEKSFIGEFAIILYNEIERKDNLNKRTTGLVQVIMDNIEENYCSNSISLDWIAQKVQKNSAYISKLFKKETGYNFSDYIAKKRIEKSKELLKDYAIKIYEIAGAVGYADDSNFIKVFKKYCGISPNEYRNIYEREEIK